MTEGKHLIHHNAIVSVVAALDGHADASGARGIHSERHAVVVVVHAIHRIGNGRLPEHVALEVASVAVWGAEPLRTAHDWAFGVSTGENDAENHDERDQNENWNHNDQKD